MDLIKLKTDWQECYNKEQLICPYCGVIQQDYWLIDYEKDDNHICSHCERPFSFTTQVTKTFTSLFSKDVFRKWEINDLVEDPNSLVLKIEKISFSNKDHNINLIKEQKIFSFFGIREKKEKEKENEI